VETSRSSNLPQPKAGTICSWTPSRVMSAELSTRNLSKRIAWVPGVRWTEAIHKRSRTGFCSLWLVFGVNIFLKPRTAWLFGVGDEVPAAEIEHHLPIRAHAINHVGGSGHQSAEPFGPGARRCFGWCPNLLLLIFGVCTADSRHLCIRAGARASNKAALL
jgi:hypothetical protein